MPRFRQKAEDSSGETVTVNYSGPYWFCNEVHLKLGRAPGYAIAHIPLKATDETAPQVAGVRGGPLDNIKIGTPAAVYDVFSGNENLVMTGYVMNVRQDLKDDAASVVIMDHRIILAGLKMVGQFHISGTTGVGYRQRARCLMNPDGQPNCTGYVDAYGTMVPIFCPPNYGLTAGTAPPQALTVGTASYWTPEFALQYIRWVQTNIIAQSTRTDSHPTSVSPTPYPFAFLSGAPSLITWAPTYYDVINGQNATATSSIRKAREIDLEGQSVLDAISECLEMAGKFALNIKAADNYKGIIEVVPTRYSGDGISIARATAGNANPNLDNCVFAAGTIEEDGTDLYTMVGVAGETVYIEKRFDTVSGSLSWAYAADDFTAWKSYQSSATPLNRLTKFEEANSRYNKVLSALRVTTTYDYQGGTDEEGMPLANIGKAPLPNLLTPFLEGSNVTLTEKLSAPRPICFEYSEDGGTTWLASPEPDGLTINQEDGTLHIDGWRAAGRTFIASSDEEELEEKLADVANVTPVDIRVTLAMPCDHRLTAARKLTTDSTPNVAPSTDAHEDSDRIEPDFSRLMYIDADRLYAKYIRDVAYPITQSAGGTAQSDELRNDTTYIEAHAQRKISDFGRIKKSARLTYPLLYSLWRPGYVIRELQNIGSANTVTSAVPIRAVCHEVIMRSSKLKNETELHLG